MIPFGNQIVTLFHHAADGYRRYTLTGCSWRSSHGRSLYDNAMQSNRSIVCSCRYPADQMRASEGDVFVRGIVTDTITSGTQIAALMEKYKDRGAFICHTFADNSAGGMPMPHFAQRVKAMEFRLRFGGAKINTDEIMHAVRGDKLGKFAAVEWLRLYRKYMPYEPRSTSIEPWLITHREPYAHYDYEGNVRGPNVPIRGGEAWFSPKAPKALTGAKLKFAKGTHHWDQKAIPTQKDKLVRAMQAFIDGGNLW